MFNIKGVIKEEIYAFFNGGNHSAGVAILQVN